VSKIEGIENALKQFAKLETGLATKTVRSASMQSTTPIFRKMKAKIPVGSKAHKTYRKRLVGPGFAKRSLKRRSRVLRNGRVLVTIGVINEAFYAINFHDQGVKNISTRRIKGKRGKQSIKPYDIPARHWFKRVFEQGQNAMTKQFSNVFRKKIDQVTRG